MKVNDLEERYRQLLMPVIRQDKVNITASHTLTESSRNTVTSTSSSISQMLDFSSVMKACQALSEEIVLEQLIAKLMQVAIENAGATKGILILLKNQTLVMAAKALSHETEVTVSFPNPEDFSLELPVTVINYIQHIRKPLVVNHPSINHNWMTDAYIQQNSPQCLLGLPLLHQNKLLGILYLENQLTADIFTVERLEVLNILTTQAAISLENANLYQTLQGSNKALIESLQKLQDAQLQMIQSEKMSALGNLVAGVAHEINNPVGFIAGNLNEATTAVQDLIDCLQCYQEKFPNPGSEIEDKLEEVDLEYIIEDLPKMLSSMKVGCDRIRNISTSLRTFSRADTDQKVAADVHEGIDSTLMILQHRIKAKEDRPAIVIVKNYGKLPKINCFLGQLNQVFMNILANAIDIFAERNKGRTYKEIEAHPNVITITTQVSEDNQNVILKIRDNGAGMSESVKARIFDHLFTTKPVGKGTGLGLSISRQIVEEVHGGSITCESILGEGTEFLITLP
jgi:signal transduction histidine kinase